MTNFEKMALEVINKEIKNKYDTFAFFCDKFYDDYVCNKDCPVKKIFPDCRDLTENEWGKIIEYFNLETTAGE